MLQIVLVILTWESKNNAQVIQKERSGKCLYIMGQSIFDIRK